MILKELILITSKNEMTAPRELDSAWEASSIPNTIEINAIIADKITEIMANHDLTYRYILVTGILGKIVNPDIHPRALQKRSLLKGAYDARSLCHKVVVPFEHSKGDLWGLSNEPFLNKPARHPELDKNNPQLRDKIGAGLAHDVLEWADTSSNTSVVWLKNSPYLLSSAHLAHLLGPLYRHLIVGVELQRGAVAHVAVQRESAGARLGHMLAIYGGGLACAVGAIAAHFRWGLPLPLKDYQLKRLVVFMNPGVDPLGAGYQLRQSVIAVGSGRLFGKGLFSGTQNQLRFLPFQHTDFIFSVIGEELGFVGGACILILYLLVIWRGVRIAASAKDTFGALLATGVVSMLAFHIIVNIGMTIGVMPVTGIPLPFMSYGGTSLVTNMVGIGILLNVHVRRHRTLF